MQPIYQGIVTDENEELLPNMKQGLQSIITGEREGDVSELLQQYDEFVYQPARIIGDQLEPSRWASSFVELIEIIRGNKELDSKIFTGIKKFFPKIKNALTIPIRTTIPKTTIYAIQKIDQYLPRPDYEPFPYQIISLEELVSKIPGAKTEIRLVKDMRVTYLVVDDVFGGTIEIPLIKGVYHKGGASRLILKLFFNSPWIKGDAKIKDWDILVFDPRKGAAFLEIVGEKDLSGIEILSSMDYAMYSRDVTLNCCFLGIDGLYFIEEAMHAAITGVTRLCSGHHGLYGADYFLIVRNGKEIRFLRGRTVERGIKTIVDDKAGTLMMKKYHLQVNMGISPLIGAVRKIGTPEWAERLEKFYYMLGQMGQIAQYRHIFEKKLGLPCNNLFEFMEGMHTMYPFVKFEKLGEEEGVARWLLEKLFKWLRQYFIDAHELYIGKNDWLMVDPNEDEDEGWIEFNLDGFRSNPKTVERINLWLPGYQDRCKQRKKEHDAEPVKTYI